MTEIRAGLPVLRFASAALFEQWLARQAAGSAGLWLQLAKKSAGVPSVSKQEAIEVALCHGWIDGQLQPFDGRFWLVRFTPRSARSHRHAGARRSGAHAEAKANGPRAGIAWTPGRLYLT